MFYCKKCKKEVNKKEDLYKGLCDKCYYDYLTEKIENIGNPNYIDLYSNDLSISVKLKSLCEKIRNLFKKSRKEK